MPNDPFVDVTELPSLGPLRYLDVRDRASFDAGHAPGAVRVPLDEWDAAAKAADTGFAKTAYWDRALNALGANPTLTAVTYDSGGMTNAARVWFILQYYGLKAEWRLAYPCRDDRTAAGSSGLVRRLPRGAGLRTGRAERP
jgi:thiosulfate/3-mercaptopyruvate sulfurtransferase